MGDMIGLPFWEDHPACREQVLGKQVLRAGSIGRRHLERGVWVREGGDLDRGSLWLILSMADMLELGDLFDMEDEGERTRSCHAWP